MNRQTLFQVIVDEVRNVGTEIHLVDRALKTYDLKPLQLYQVLVDLFRFQSNRLYLKTVQVNPERRRGSTTNWA